MIVREAKLEDIEGIREIYNEAILNSTATFDTEEKSYEDRVKWLESHDEKFPVVVLLEKDILKGWGSLTAYSNRKAYSGTCELSIYIHKNHRGNGYGKIIIEELLSRAKKNNIHVILSRVAGENEASKNLHKQYGFRLIGVMEEVGHKFGKYIDVNFYQKLIKE